MKSLGVPHPWFEPVDADLLAGGHRVGERKLLERRVQPRPATAVRREWVDLFGELGECRWFLSRVKMPFSMHNRANAISGLRSRISSPWLHGAVVVVIMVVVGHVDPLYTASARGFWVSWLLGVRAREAPSCKGVRSRSPV